MTKEKRNRPTTGDSPLKMGSLWIQAYRLNPSKPSSQESRGFNHGSVNTAIYRYERFDPAVNKELWRRIPGWKLRFTWLKAWMEHDKAARIGYKAWLYARVSSGGEWLTGDMLDWNQEIVK